MTTKASQKDSLSDCASTSESQPKRLGKITVWPRLETGKSSVTPCRRPRTIAWK